MSEEEREDYSEKRRINLLASVNFPIRLVEVDLTALGLGVWDLGLAGWEKRTHELYNQLLIEDEKAGVTFRHHWYKIEKSKADLAGRRPEVFYKEVRT